jgi:HPt (histidine-containing phosphotransfer) domain-containing protein
MSKRNDFEAIVPTDLLELIPVFLENSQKGFQSLIRAIAAADFEMVHLIGHRMKGSGSSYGFETISAMGLEIEERAKARDKTELIRLAAKYRHYLANVQITYQDG